MSQTRQQSESQKDKAEANIESESQTDSRFKDLARGLLGVTREQLREEQERYAEERQKKKRKP